jgi:hypothetical protein
MMSKKRMLESIVTVNLSLVKYLISVTSKPLVEVTTLRCLNNGIPEAL